jgi:hypothetical protein
MRIYLKMMIHPLINLNKKDRKRRMKVVTINTMMGKEIKIFYSKENRKIKL